MRRSTVVSMITLGLMAVAPSALAVGWSGAPLARTVLAQ